MFSAVVILFGLAFIPVEVRAETVAEFRARKMEQAKGHRDSTRADDRKYLKPEKNPDEAHEYHWTTKGWKYEED